MLRAVLFPIDMGNYKRNSLPIPAIFESLRKASRTAQFVGYHWRRSGNFVFTASHENLLPSVAELGQAVTGLPCIVRKIEELRVVLGAVPAETHSTQGGSVVLHTSKGPQKLIHIALSSDVAPGLQAMAQLSSRVSILKWPSSHDVLCMYSRPSVGGDVGQVTQAVLNYLEKKAPGVGWHATGRAIGVIREIVEGTRLRAPSYEG